MQRITLTASVLSLVVFLGGCQSQWYLEKERPNKVTTVMLVRSEPTGAAITFDERELDRAPLRMPVVYHHVEQLWKRQTNQGVRLRESWGTVGTIVGFPVWMIASFFQTTEDRRRHLYGENVHVVGAALPGHHRTSEQVTFEGQDEIEVTLTLQKR